MANFISFLIVRKQKGIFFSILNLLSVYMYIYSTENLLFQTKSHVLKYLATYYKVKFFIIVLSCGFILDLEE